MFYLSLVSPCFSASIAQPERGGGYIRRNVLAIWRVNGRRRIGRHEYFDRLVRVSDGPIVKAALYPIVANILTRA